MITHRELDIRLRDVYWGTDEGALSYYQLLARELYRFHLFALRKEVRLNEAQLKVLVDCGL